MLHNILLYINFHHFYHVTLLTGVSVHVPRQRNSTYIHTVRRSIYKTRHPEHPHLPILQYERVPQGPVPCPCYIESFLVTDQIYATATSISTVLALLQIHNHQKESVYVSKSRPSSRQISDAISVIFIDSYTLAAVSGWI